MSDMRQKLYCSDIICFPCQNHLNSTVNCENAAVGLKLTLCRCFFGGWFP